MAIRRAPRSVAAVALVLAVVLSGCSAVSLTTDDVSATEIGERAQEKYESIDSYEGTVTTSITSADANLTTTANVWVRPHSNQMRYEYVSPEPMNGTTRVTNGSVTWSYNRSENTVRKTDLSGIDAGVAATNYSRVFENTVDQYDVSYEGSATVGDRSTHVIELTPENGSSTAAIDQWTLWIDEDRWFPVRTQTEASVDGRTMTTTTEYTNLSFDTDVPDDTFEFDPPADATVEENEVPDIEQYESVAEADAHASLDVTEPGQLPADYEFTRATVSNRSEFQSVTLIYENDSNALTVQQFTQESAGAEPDATVNGHEATVDTYGETTSVTWTCDGRTYSVTGRLPTDELTDVAASLDCG